jgi:hypothetical protein
MPKSLPSHVQCLLDYLSQPNEKANEDRALTYFREIYGESFTRQKDAKRADGYVPGHFVLELKGERKNWLSGLIQGLAYRNQDLDFGQIVVAARNFLAIWQVEDIPESLRDEVLADTRSPSAIGTSLAKKYSRKRNELLRLANWTRGTELSGGLFATNPEAILSDINSFEETLRAGRKVRQKITLRNFASILRGMTKFFDPTQPVKTVRGFYSMLYGWDETSTLQLSDRANDQATLGGEVITNLAPSMRGRFKDFVENHSISLGADENRDDFFARFDEALDAVDKQFRIRNGIFFTDLALSRFVMWLVKCHIPELGKNYLVIDPACGSGNLVTNWRSPLDLRHKVVSEIEPELLFAVEKRMKGDQWHAGKYTVIPKVSENKGLNFLDRSAADYLEEIRKYLLEKGHKPDKPLAFLCNPPYRNDDDQAASTIPYELHPSILEITDLDASSERYCCFLAQMKLICESAEASRLPGDSLLLLFTKSAWLTKRAVFEKLRANLLGVFEDVAGILINGKEFFDVKGTWPVAFTIWRYKGRDANLNAHRSVPLIDLTWLKKTQLAGVSWDDPDETERSCRNILSDRNSGRVELGNDRVNIRDWSGKKRVDFLRSRRKDEINQRVVGGLPAGDRRHQKKKAHGETDGNFIGFLDDLTLCRVKTSIPDRPWFRLNNQFMDIRKTRCFSGPPSNRGYCATELKSAQKLFFWYSLARTFTQCAYPMWVDADDMWSPTIPPHIEKHVFQIAFAIGYAENECLEARFPANNPVRGVPELMVCNPMTPLNPNSFWSTVMLPFMGARKPAAAGTLIAAVDELFADWRKLFKTRSELPMSRKPYLFDDGGLTIGAGITQIRDYATETGHEVLLADVSRTNALLKTVKNDFFEQVSGKSALDYFGGQKSSTSARPVMPVKTQFEKVLARRLAVVGILINELSGDPNFGRTKLSKLFYLADAHHGLELDTQYYREAAGPLDPRTLYDEHIGIESMGQKYGLFTPQRTEKMIRYRPEKRLADFVKAAPEFLGDKAEAVSQLAEAFRDLNTSQSEIVATLYACWNDSLLQARVPSDGDIANDFLRNWHQRKTRFPKTRLFKALKWMRQNRLVPRGEGKITRPKSTEPEMGT